MKIKRGGLNNFMLHERSRLIAVLGFLLLIPVLATAQDRYDPWSSDNRNYGGQRRNDDWDRRGRGRDYNRRDLRQAVDRIDRLSGQIKSDLGDALDRSRLNGRDVEDKLNQLTHDFHEAAAKFKDRFDDGRDFQRAEGEARRVLELGSEIDSFISRYQLNSKVDQKWSQISSDLEQVANVYGYGSNSFNDSNREYRRRRRNDDRWRRSQY